MRNQVGDLVRYRELVRLLTLKEVKLRYKDSFLGFLWSLVNPLLLTLVFYIVFVVLLPQGHDPACDTNPGLASCQIKANYAPFILIGILAWNFTAGSILSGMNSLLNNASISKKVYFPREVLPLSSVLAQFVNFLLALIPLVVLLVISGIVPNIYAIVLPVVFFSNILFLAGLAMFLSIAIMYFRDLGVIMEVLLQAWFFLSPVIYSMDQVYKGAAGIIYWLNPVASYIETYRAVLFFNYAPELGFTLRTILTGVLFFVLGYAFFIWKRKQIGEML